MKTKRIHIICFGVILLQFGYMLWEDYSWGIKNLAKVKLQVVYTQKGMSLFRPWTWIIKPINQICWLEWARKHDDRFVIVQLYYTDNGILGLKPLESKTAAVVDLKLRKTATINEDNMYSINSNDLDSSSKFKWSLVASELADLLNKGDYPH